MPELKQVPLSFDVKLYGKMEQYDDSKSKCRVRIFYKGLNRNRTYISEDFANQLIQSLPYAPVKGIFDSDEVDFKSHGEKNNEGRIYGIVMADPEFAWEEHTDTDGITRTYACASVLLYTSLYNEAKIIPESSQSMEINPFTYDGEWRTWEDGKPYFHFTKGSLFGLQVLGTMTEPCFEGAAFYNLIFNKLKEDYQPLIDYVKNIEKKEEKVKMGKDAILFKLSDREKANLIWDSLNPEFNEENNWKEDYCLLEVYDNYAVVAKVDTKELFRVYYTKNDKDDSVVLGEFERCFFVDVTESEMKALDAMKAAAGNFESYVNANEELTNNFEANKTELEELKNTLAEEQSKYEALNSELAEKTSEFEDKIAEYEGIISDKDSVISEAETKYTALENEKVELENKNNDLINEKEDLASFKHSVETKEKEDFLMQYVEHLTESAVEDLKSKIEEYSIEDFKKEVSYLLIENKPTIFDKNDKPDRYYKGSDLDDSKGLQGWERILKNHKNGGNK